VHPLGWHPYAAAANTPPAADSEAASIQAAQWFGTLGLFPGYDARLAEPITAAVKTAWEEAIAAATAAAAAGTAFDPTAAARRVALAEAAEREQPPEDPASSGQTRGEWLEAAWRKAGQP